MIYILVGNDTKKKNNYIKTLSGNKEVVFLSTLNINKELINNHANNISLFGDSLIIVIENIIKQKEIIFTEKDLKELRDSKTIFVFIEDKILAQDKIYKKFAEVVLFEDKIIKPVSKINLFAIADAFENRDKIKSWLLYCEAINAGIEPEPIAGILFWKIKTMISSNSKTFNLNQLRRESGDLVDIYHRSHRGNMDFVIGLEQFILSSLNK